MDFLIKFRPPNAEICIYSSIKSRGELICSFQSHSCLSINTGKKDTLAFALRVNQWMGLWSPFSESSKSTFQVCAASKTSEWHVWVVKRGEELVSWSKNRIRKGGNVDQSWCWTQKQLCMLAVLLPAFFRRWWCNYFEFWLPCWLCQKYFEYPSDSVALWPRHEFFSSPKCPITSLKYIYIYKLCMTFNKKQHLSYMKTIFTKPPKGFKYFWQMKWY